MFVCNTNGSKKLNIGILHFLCHDLLELEVEMNFLVTSFSSLWSSRGVLSRLCQYLESIWILIISQFIAYFCYYLQVSRKLPTYFYLAFTFYLRYFKKKNNNNQRAKNSVLAMECFNKKNAHFSLDTS